jgi:hypothetical protein
MGQQSTDHAEAERQGEREEVDAAGHPGR